ncbi:hypothetical protein Tco_0192700, partial [Tanacetum coccineum]
KEDNVNSTNNVNAASTNEVNAIGGKTSIKLPFDPNMPTLEDYSIFDSSRDDGAEADMNNLETTIQVSPIPTTRIHKNHHLDQVIEDLQSATQIRKMSKNFEEHGFEEPKKVLKRPFDLVAYTDSDYAGASLDMKSTIGGCQFLGCRLISWQCKKQTVVANFTTEAEYVAASSCCG